MVRLPASRAVPLALVGRDRRDRFVAPL